MNKDKLEHLMRETLTEGYPEDVMRLANAIEDQTRKDVEDLVQAVHGDSWCQECGLEKTAPALAKLLEALGLVSPDWLKAHIKNNPPPAR